MAEPQSARSPRHNRGCIGSPNGARGYGTSTDYVRPVKPRRTSRRRFPLFQLAKGLQATPTMFAPVTGRRQDRSAGSAVCYAMRLIFGSTVFISVLVFFWIVVGIGTASSAPCPPGTVPAPPPLSGCLVLVPCAAGQATPSGYCCPTLTTPQPDNTCQPRTPPQEHPCPQGEVPGPNATCVCPPFQVQGPNGCRFITLCPKGQVLLEGSCQLLLQICPAWQQTNTGTCCPQNQYPAPDGTCQQLCAPGQILDFNTGTCEGPSPGCTQFPALPQSVYKGPCCAPGQVPAMNGAEYSGFCCPAGQTPDPQTDSCLPPTPVVLGGPAVPGACPLGTIMTNRYTCCPLGQYPQPNGTCGCPWTTYTNYPSGICAPLCPAPPNSGPPTQVPSPQNCSNCPPALQGWPGCCHMPTGTCDQCPFGGVATSLGCCPPNQAVSDGSFCCYSGSHAEGNACVPNSMSTPRNNCPPGQTRQDNGTCGVKPPVETPGLPVEPKVPGRSDNPTQCGGGLVERNAFRGDPACVARAVYDRTIADNIAAPERTKPDGSCVRGYVWREANASDHTCVLPATRAQTWSDNRRQCGDDRCTAHGVPAQNTVPERTRTTTVTEHPKRNIFRSNRSRGGATSHRWTGHRTTTHAPSGHRTSFRGGGGGFHAGSFHGGGFRGGGGGRRR